MLFELSHDIRKIIWAKARFLQAQEKLLHIYRPYHAIMTFGNRAVQIIDVRLKTCGGVLHLRKIRAYPWRYDSLECKKTLKDTNVLRWRWTQFNEFFIIYNDNHQIEQVEDDLHTL